MQRKSGLIRTLHKAFKLFGLDLSVTAASVGGLGRFWRAHRSYKRLAKDGKLFPLRRLYPCLGEDRLECGQVPWAYFYQDLWVAQLIRHAQPNRHLDVGSRLDGFVGNVASFRKIEVMDIRPLTKSIPNVVFRQIDLMKPIPSEWESCCDSLSCLHAMEHFGLGRYGDPVNPEGYRAGYENLVRLVQPGGTFYLSVPIGPQRIEFNAHRVFSAAYLVEMVSAQFDVVQLSYVDDEGGFHPDAGLRENDLKASFGCNFGCGIVCAKKHKQAHD